MKKIISLIMAVMMLACTVTVNAEELQTDNAEAAEAVQSEITETTEEVQPEATKAPVMKEIYVSGMGDDANDGSKSSPFKTLERAKQEARKYNDNMTGDIIVNIAAGTYYLENTLEFSNDDSASNGYSVIYKGADAENTILSGGVKLTDWKLYDSSKNIWVAEAPGVKSRQMFVNGERRWRASTTNSPKLSNETDTGNFIIESNDILTGINNITEVEIIWKKTFSDYRMPIKALEGNKLIMPEANQTYRVPASQPIMRVENAYEWLDEKGEWYLNTSESKVYYMPKDGEDLNEEEIILAKLEKIVDIQGTENNLVTGITFSKVTMKDVTWMGPNDLNYGYSNFQAGFCRERDPYYGDNDYYNVKSAVCVVFADNIHVERCILRNLGGAGAWMRKGVKNSSMVGNLVYDVSQNGLMLGNTFTSQAQKESTLCDNVRVENNIVHDVGIEYLGAVGIFGGLPRNSSVSHNEVYNTPYTCISFGWGWLNEWPKTADKNDTVSMLNTDNKVVGNYVHDGMTKLADGGGIYLLGITPGVLVAENVVSNMGKNESFAYYFDNGTRWGTMKDNVCYDVEVALYSKGADNKFYNNYFDASFDNTSVIGSQRTGHSEYKQLPVPEGHQNQIYDNTVVKDGRFPNYIMMNAGVEYEYQDLKGLVGNKEENIAKNGTAYALKADGTAGRFMTGKSYTAAVDGNASTEMRATGKEQWTADIDLGAKRNLTKLRILFGSSYIPKSIKLAVSENGKDFTEIPVEEIQQDNEIILDGTVARNVQLQVLEGEMSIAEFEAYADDFIPVVTEADRMANLTLVTFDDIKSHWAKSSIEYLASLGIIKGDSDTTFTPDRQISRSEWIVLVTRVLNIQKVPYLENYSDVAKTDWFADNIQAASEAGLLQNSFSDDTLMPLKAITRAEAAATLDTVKFEQPDENDEEAETHTVSDFVDLNGNPYAASIDYILQNGIMVGESETYFNANASLTRAQAAVMLERVLLKAAE